MLLKGDLMTIFAAVAWAVAAHNSANERPETLMNHEGRNR
jgi:hypothetical protein